MSRMIEAEHLASHLQAPLAVNLAPTGMVPMRQHSPHVPLSPQEIVKCVLECAELGIASVHLHARDDLGKPAYSKEIYARIIYAIREQRPDLVICVSCSGRDGATIEQRSEVLSLQGDVKPDMASLTLSSLNFSTGPSVNSLETVRTLARRMADQGIRPEIEVFDQGMANVLKHLIDRGVVEGPLYVNLLFGNIASAQARLTEIAALIAVLPPTALYSLAGLGSVQLAVAATAVAAAGGVRIGLEDNLWLDAERATFASNRNLVDRVNLLASAVGRRLMTPTELRTRLRLTRSE